MAEKATVTPRGGPTHKGNAWNRIIETVVDQVESLLTAIGLTGEFLLTAMQARKGGSHNQGLHIQRYDDSDPVRPAVFLLAQPEGNDTCWLYRLQLPKGTNAKAAYELIEASLQQQPREREQRENVVPLQPEPVMISVPARSPEPRINTEPRAGAGKSVAGMSRDPVIAAAMLSHLLEAAKKEGNEHVFDGKMALNVFDDLLGEGYTRRQAGTLLGAFVKQKYLQHDMAAGMYCLTEFGAAILRKQGIEVSAAVRPSAKPTPPPQQKAPPQPAPAQTTDHLQAMRAIMDRAMVYQEAQRAVSEQRKKIDDLRNRIANLDRERNQLTKSEAEAVETLKNAERILADPVFKRAVEQRAEMRRLLGD